MNKESKSTEVVESTINKNVFFTSAFFILLITAVGSFWPGHLSQFFKGIQAWLIAKASWVYVLAMGIILFTSLWLMVSRLGDIKLGPDHSEPSYTNLSWFAMLFSAGMGIGLLFFGVAEPIMHFNSPPVGDPQTIESAREAMKITFFHWGLHAWGAYALLAVCLAYFCYRKGLPLLPRSAFYPILGEKVHGPLGDIVDTFAVIGTMFGVATSLGFGVAQVNAGLHYLIGIPQSETIQVGLIAIITAMATVSVVLGLDGGIKKLSNINLAVAVLLLVAVMVLGDTVHLFQQYVQNTGSYLSDIIYKTFNLYAYEKKEEWIGGWTLLYWGWWISWSPFVGMFIARISRGRTIREFMIGVLFVPAGFTFLWMTVFGNSAISIALKDTTGEFVAAVTGNVPVALFRFFEFFPFSSALSILGVILVITFFVSSSDSGSLVIDTLASGGKQEPPVWQRVFWAVTEGVVAAVLLHSGGLEALQTMTIASAFPMIFLLLIAVYCLIKSLRSDYLLRNQVLNHTSSVQYEKASMTWKEHLNALLSHPKHKVAEEFLADVVEPGLKELQQEFIKNGLEAVIRYGKDDAISLVIEKEGVEDFKYEVYLRSFEVPDFLPGNQEKYYRAEVFLLSGGQEYDIYGYSKEQIVADAVTQYEKHYQYLHLTNSELV
ncbi:BCCT family transporter [Halobacteriovorax sp. HFRX-2_2]|uniref:BCCT family transporter n=1 Tax=unclassified Halobacteriovorax TaxID=2639665 RepID=UPI003715C374